MEGKFHNEDFEDLIRQKADQYKMYPSDKVWRGIHNSLHSRKKWYWSGFVLLLSGVSYFAITELVSAPAVISIVKKQTASNPEKPSLQTDQLIPFSALVEKEKSIKTDNVQLQAPQLTPFLSEGPDLGNFYIIPDGMASQQEGILQAGEKNDFALDGVRDRDDLSTANSTSTLKFNNNLSRREISIVPENRSLEPAGTLDNESDYKKVNWLQEYALYDLSVPKMKRISWQLSFSPTINYRILTGSRNANIASNGKNIPFALNIEGALNNLVNHKPAIGFELGSFALYAVNNRLSLKTGLQFNYSRYDIEAYSSPTEIATIALNNNNGYNIDSITSYTRLSNFGGYAAENLRNQYFQLSLPVGLEFRILGNHRLQLNIAGTIQPTYLMNRNTYLISTDYKNYTKEPSLVRRWNVNTSAEAFVSYNAAGLRWQVGPQFRYQLFSSYANEYPIKEYLMEYGMKIGITKTIR